MREVVIIAGARTPIGKFGGAFAEVDASELGAVAIRAAVQRAGLRPEAVEQVIMGHVIQAGDSGYMARKAALGAGLPEATPAMTVNRACSSGLEAINLAAHSIMVGDADVIVAGGAESMSRVPHLLPNARFTGLRYGDATLIDALTLGLSCPIYDYHMGVTAENIAERYEVSRETQDRLALESHRRAVAAQEAGYFEAQIAPVDVTPARGQAHVVGRDEHPRADTSMVRLAALAPAFRPGGTVTAGNAAGMNDAAAAVVVASADWAQAQDLRPRMRWVGRAVAGVDPAYMGTGPVPATRRLLERTDASLADIDLIELNEAFAAQAAYVIRELDLDEAKTNVNGSGISLGHPLGATGAIMAVKLMDELERTDGQLGLATLCVGGGQGVATLFERAS